ncbi:MAG: hypothetical protein AAF958_10620 [Planctomycetota bacterium]
MMDWDMEFFRETFAVLGSAAALASTLYFWLVRANRERAKVVAMPVGPLTGTVLGNMDYETQRRVGFRDGHVCVKYWLELAILNHASLPNAIVGIRVWIKFRDPEKPFRSLWHEMDVVSGEAPIPQERADPVVPRLLPINVGPQSTGTRRLALATLIPGDASGGFNACERQAGDALPHPVPIRVEITTLGQRTFMSEFVDDGKALSRTELEMAEAA